MRTPLPENREKVVNALKQRPMSIPEISRAAVVSQPCIRNVIDILHAEGGCFIDHWEIRDESWSRTAIYALGQGVDAKRPTAKPPREHRKKYKEKRLVEVCAREEAKISERTRQELARPAFRHQFDVWLFGPAKTPSKPSMVNVRVFQQSMTVTRDELEEA